MDNRGEVEVRLNTRWIERAFFLLVIIGLVILYFMKASPDTSKLEASVASLEQQASEKDALVQQLHQQIDALNRTNKTQTIIIVQNTTPAQPTPPPAPALVAGVPTVSWSADAPVLKAVDYNAATIASLQANLTDYQNEYENASGSAASDLRDLIDETKATINSLKFGSAKVSLRNITLVIDNSNFTATTLDYEVCWLSLDCSIVKSEGSIKVAAGKKIDSTLALTIPTLLALDKTQTLSITVTQGTTTIISDSQTFNRVSTTT